MSSSSEIAINELAADGRTDKKGGALMPAIPIAVVVTVIVVVALGAVVGPVAWILASTSASTTSDLSSIIQGQAVLNVAAKLQDVLAFPKSMLEIVVKDTSIHNAMVFNVNNLKNETAAFKTMAATIGTSTYINGVGCTSYSNSSTTAINYFGNYKNVLSGSNDTANWWDNSTGPLLVEADWSPSTNSYLNAFTPIPVPWNSILVATPFFQYMYTNPQLTTPWFNIAFNSGKMIGSVSQLAFDPTISKTRPVYSCSFGYESELAIGAFLRTIFVTTNTKIFLMDTTTGFLLASSVANSIFSVNETDPLKTVTQWTPQQSNDTQTSLIGKAIMSKYGSYSTVPISASGAVSFQTDIGDGQQWIINTAYLNDPNTWLLVVAMPRSDFFSNVDLATKRVLIIGVAVAIGGVVITALASYLALRPLRSLVSAMALLTKMDFSALEGGDILKKRSAISEVRHLQITFATMCKAFASGIRRNRELTTGKSRLTTTNTETSSMI